MFSELISLFDCVFVYLRHYHRNKPYFQGQLPQRKPLQHQIVLRKWRISKHVHEGGRNCEAWNCAAITSKIWMIFMSLLDFKQMNLNYLKELISSAYIYYNHLNSISRLCLSFNCAFSMVLNYFLNSLLFMPISKK